MARRVSRRSSRLVALVALVLAIAVGSAAAQHNSSSNSSDSSVTFSFCEICRDKGQCGQAYQGKLGVYCGAWLSASNQQLACCCPAEGVCLRSRSHYECKCGSKELPIRKRHEVKDKNQEPDQDSRGILSSNKITWAIVASIAILVVLAMYVYTTRLDRNYHYREPPRAAGRIIRMPVPIPMSTAPQPAQVVVQTQVHQPQVEVTSK